MNETKMTTIRLHPASNEAEVKTNDVKMIHRMDKLCAECPELFRYKGREEGYKLYLCPVDCVRLRKPPTQKQLDTWKANGFANAHHLPQQKAMTI